MSHKFYHPIIVISIILLQPTDHPERLSPDANALSIENILLQIDLNMQMTLYHNYSFAKGPFKYIQKKTEIDKNFQCVVVLMCFRSQ